MTRPRELPRPTEAELSVLRVLWERGPSSVREVLEALNGARDEPLAYTTVLSFLKIMTGKGLADRDEGGRGHRYAAAVPAERTRGQLVRDLIDRAFDGSVHDLVLQALGSRKVTAEEVSEIRQMLNQMDSKP